MSASEDTIIINKYSSRRLYNTKSSEYVTLEDLYNLINSGKSFKIIDKETSTERLEIVQKLLMENQIKINNN